VISHISPPTRGEIWGTRLCCPLCPVQGSLEKKIGLQSALRALSPLLLCSRLVFLRYRPLVFFLFLLRNGRPEAGGSTCAGLVADGECCETVESGFAQLWICRGRGRERWPGCRRRVWQRWWIGIGFRRLGVLFGLRLRQETEQFGSASLNVGEGGHVGANDAGACAS
jgi:hypothetical protein